jgi:hypothetical protein
MFNQTFEQFQNAWIDMDVKGLEACLSNNVQYYASPSERSLSGLSSILNHLESIFKYLQDNNASVNVTLKDNNKLILIYLFDSLWPVTQYMVNSDGIFLVPCLEPCAITLKVVISTHILNDKIRTIKIIEEKKVECSNTAL